MNYCEKCMKPLAHGSVCERCGKQPPAPLHHLKPGTILQQKYLIGRAIGQGGFGITYIGRDLVLDTTVAIKEYYPSGEVTRDHSRANTVVQNGTASPEEYAKSLDRFLMESRILAKFSTDPGVVGVRNFFRENDTAYIVMEYLEGITLKEYLRIKGPIPCSVLLKLLEPVLQVLHKIHEGGLIHRDISPDNLMLMKDGRLKLLDFGAARAFADEKSLSIVLKQGYAPVEQYWNGDRQGAWTDVYAVCATIYKCVTGVTPTAAVQRAVQDDLKTPSQLGIAISPQQEQALMKGLAVSDADRFRSVEELVSGFAAANAAVPVAVTVPPIEQDDLYGSYASKAVENHLGHSASSRQGKKNKTSLIIALVAVAATILVLGIWMLLQISPDREPTEHEDAPSTNSPFPEKPDEPKDPIVVSVRNVTVEEGIDTLTLSFETDDNPEYWIVSCKEDGKETKRQEFTEIPVEITDLKPDTRYELELLVSEDAMLEEPVVQVGKTKAGATVVKDSFTVELDGNEAEISWQSEGTQPEQWQVTVTGDKGYREELDTKETAFTLKELVYGEVYTVEISCEYMAEAFTETFTADSLYIDAMTAELTDDGAVDVQWQCQGGEDLTWYVVCTPDDAPEQAWTQETTKQNIRLTNLRAGKTYTIELRTKEGELLDGDSAVSIDIPSSGTFSDYGFTDASAEFYLRPDGRKWDTEDLEDRRTRFSGDEQIVFVCVPTSSPDSSRDKVIVTLMVKDKTGNTVDFFNIEEKWDTLWKDGIFATELESTLSAGTYTVELYFNSLPVSLSQNSFTIEE